MKRGARIATAYHEAGLAVVAWHLGGAVKRVTIVPSEKESYSGQCSDGRVLQGRFPELDDYDSARGFLRLRKHVMISLAGMVAQRLFKPRSVRSYHGHSDYQSAVDVVMSATGSTEEAEALLRRNKNQESLTHTPEAGQTCREAVAGPQQLHGQRSVRPAICEFALMMNGDCGLWEWT